MKETDIQRSIQLALTDDRTRLWRMNVGQFQLIDGRWIVCGTPGMSDLIGLRSVTITPEMVGRTLAVFVACEVKSATGRASVEQTRFIEMVTGLGGIAGVVRSTQAAADLVRLSVTSSGATNLSRQP